MAMMEIIPLDGSTKNMVIALMNGEHPDAIRLYAKHFGRKSATIAATLTDVSNTNFTVHYKTAGRDEGDLTIAYVNNAGENITCETIGDCRRAKKKTKKTKTNKKKQKKGPGTLGAMVGMARIASEILGEKIALPEVKNTDLPGGDRQSNQPAPELIEMLKQMRQEMAAQKPEGKGQALT